MLVGEEGSHGRVICSERQVGRVAERGVHRQVQWEKTARVPRATASRAGRARIGPLDRMVGPGVHG